MSDKEIEGLISSLAQTSVGKEKSLTFDGKAARWDAEKDVAHIVEAMDNCPSLQTLRIGQCSMSVEAAKAIGKALEKQKQFQRAQLSDMFTSRLKEEIPKSLKYISAGITLAEAKLVELDLSDNALGPNGMHGITELLENEACYSLKELRLHNTGLGPTGTKMLADCLDKCYEASVKRGVPMGLRVFVAGRSRLENEGCTALSKVFQKMGTLVEIQIKQNGIHHPGIEALAKALESNPNMVHLNVNDNTLTEVGARALARVLPSLKGLEIVDCGDCLIRTSGAKILAPSLKQLHRLKKAVFSYNEVRRDGAVELLNSISDHKDLELLDLDGNQIGEEGVAEIERRVTDFGLSEELVTMNEDEGSGDEEGDEDEGQEEEPTEDQDGEEVDDPALQIHGVGLTPREKVKFSAALCDEQMAKFVDVSANITGPDGKNTSNACVKADEMFRTVLESEGTNEDEVYSMLTNALLVQLGLLKSEDKSFRAMPDISGPLYVLNHVIQQKYFPSAIRTTLQLFVGNPSPKWNNAKDSRKVLLQTLYKY